MASQPKVVVVGSINVDRFVDVPRLVSLGETLTGSNGFQCVGGKGANSAVTAAKLGADVSFIGCVGSDGAESYLIETMTSHGVNMDFIHQSPKVCGQAYIFRLPDGENAIILDPAANRDWPEFTAEQIALIESADIIMLQREIPEAINIRAAEIARGANTAVCLDAGGEDSKISDQLLSLCTIFSPNETELGYIFSTAGKSLAQMAEQLHDMGVQNVLLKRGAEGSYFQSQGQDGFSIDAFKVDVRDTTGAGDCFTGAFAVQFAKKADPQDAVRFANAAGGLCCTKSGTIPSMPSLQAVSHLIEEWNTLDDLC